MHGIAAVRSTRRTGGLWGLHEAACGWGVAVHTILVGASSIVDSQPAKLGVCPQQLTGNCSEAAVSMLASLVVVAWWQDT